MFTKKVAKTEDGILDNKELLKVLREVKAGNFSVRMPNDKIGVSGKVCETLNEIIEFNEKMMQEFMRAEKVIGKQGKIAERIPTLRSKGSWGRGVESINTLISDLVNPTV